jgi:Smg protein
VPLRPCARAPTFHPSGVRRRRHPAAARCGARTALLASFGGGRYSFCQMFDVLVYLYENYSALESCPDADALSQKLVAAGFEKDEITDALGWLHDLSRVSRDAVALSPPSDTGFRVFAPLEHERLGAEGLAFLAFLEAAGQLSPTAREVVVDRVLAVGESPIAIDKLKIIVLMVLWSQESDIDLLILEELLDDGEDRLLH